MDFSEILPIGTVCKLKGARKKIMIIGYEKNNKRKSMDFNYIGCQFPEGITSKKGQLYFLYENIDKIYFMGYNEQISNISSKKVIKEATENKPVEIKKIVSTSADETIQSEDISKSESNIMFDDDKSPEQKEQESTKDAKTNEILDSIPTQ